MGIIYQQKFGAAMGSPVSPLLASLFIEWLEKHAIAKVPAERKPFWDRYELIKKGQVRNLTDHMNTTDPTVNIKFSNKEEDKQPILRHSSSPTGRWISETSSIRSWVRIKRWTVWTINYLSSERYTREMLQWWRRRRRIERRLTRCQSAQHLPGPSTRLNRTSRRKHRRTNQRKERIYEVNTKAWLSCHNVKGLSVMLTLQFWNPAASPQLTVLTAQVVKILWAWPIWGDISPASPWRLEPWNRFFKPQPAQATPLCTKCNSPPINGRCTNHRIAVLWSVVALRF